MAKVSIIVPAFNCEAYIEDCIRSVTRQSEKEIEIVVVDDGSTDRTLTILERLAAEDSRVSVQSYRPNSGHPGFARNRGIARATGEYVAFLDSDDLYHPDKVRRILAVFRAFPEAEVVFHDVMRFDGVLHEHGTSYLTTSRFTVRAADYLDKVEDNVYLCHKDLYRFASLEVVPCHTSAIAIRRDVLLAEPVWFPEDRHAGEDGDLWLRLLKKHRFLFVDVVLSYYRQRSGSITSNAIQYLVGAVRVHRDNLERGRDVFANREIRLYNAKIAQSLAELGYAYFSRCNPGQARQAYLESLATDFRIDTLAAYLKTFVPLRLVAKYRNPV